MKAPRALLNRRRRSARGQSAVEYVMVISVLAIATLAAVGPFQSAFNYTMMDLTDSLATSLTSDGIRP